MELELLSNILRNSKRLHDIDSAILEIQEEQKQKRKQYRAKKKQGLLEQSKVREFHGDRRTEGIINTILKLFIQSGVQDGGTFFEDFKMYAEASEAGMETFNDALKSLPPDHPQDAKISVNEDDCQRLHAMKPAFEFILKMGSSAPFVDLAVWSHEKLWSFLKGHGICPSPKPGHSVLLQVARQLVELKGMMMDIGHNNCSHSRQTTVTATELQRQESNRGDSGKSATLATATAVTTDRAQLQWQGSSCNGKEAAAITVDRQQL